MGLPPGMYCVKIWYNSSRHYLIFTPFSQPTRCLPFTVYSTNIAPLAEFEPVAFRLGGLPFGLFPAYAVRNIRIIRILRNV